MGNGTCAFASPSAADGGGMGGGVLDEEVERVGETAGTVAAAAAAAAAAAGSQDDTAGAEARVTPETTTEPLSATAATAAAEDETGNETDVGMVGDTTRLAAVHARIGEAAAAAAVTCTPTGLAWADASDGKASMLALPPTSISIGWTSIALVLPPAGTKGIDASTCSAGSGFNVANRPGARMADVASSELGALTDPPAAACTPTRPIRGSE